MDLKDASASLDLLVQNSEQVFQSGVVSCGFLESENVVPCLLNPPIVERPLTQVVVETIEPVSIHDGNGAWQHVGAPAGALRRTAGVLKIKLDKIGLPGPSLTEIRISSLK